MSKQTKQNNKMLEQPVPSLLVSMSVPMMLSMVVQALYNIVDSMFVARLGVQALTAVSYIFPLQSLVLSLAVGFGVGINAVIAMNLGMGNQEKANQAATLGMALTVLHGLLFVVLGVAVPRPFLQLFTDDGQVMQWGCQYAGIVFIFSMGYLLQISMEKIFQSVGEMLTTMVLLASGCIMNIILDPILIFGWFGVPAMGVAGAAVATVLGQTAAFFLYVLVYRRQKAGRTDPSPLLQMERADRVEALLYRYSGGHYHGAAVCFIRRAEQAGIGLWRCVCGSAGDLFQAADLSVYAVQRYHSGHAAILSCNYGAGRRDRLWQTIACSIGAVLAIMLLGTLLCWLLPEPIMRLFDDDTQLLAIGVQALPVISMGFALSAAGVVTCGVLEALGRGIASLCLSLLRQFVLTVPLAWWLIGHLGVDAVWMALPIAEGAAFLFALFLLWRLWREAGPRAE